MKNKNYKTAEVNQNEFNAIKKAEEEVQNVTGKDFVMIAYEKK